MTLMKRGALVICLSAWACNGFELEQPRVSGDGGSRDLATSQRPQAPRDQAAHMDPGSPGALGALLEQGAPAEQGAPTGPGPWGALPTGYCCTSDEQCRFRACREFNGIRMCVDDCSHLGGCQGHLAGFTCEGAPWGQCAPIAPDQACVPAHTFPGGPKELGACCTATRDGAAGLECEGGRCVAFGDQSNPFFCSRVCSKPADCPPPHTCSPVSGHSICSNLSESYTCR